MLDSAIEFTPGPMLSSEPYFSERIRLLEYKRRSGKSMLLSGRLTPAISG
jgi:hypothetical protein